MPYRDLFDMNFPGIYVVHRVVTGIGGYGDAAWRAFDLLWLALTCVLLFRFCRPFGRLASVGAASMFALWHTMGGPLSMGQRDFLVATLLLASFEPLARGLGVWPE